MNKIERLVREDHGIFQPESWRQGEKKSLGEYEQSEGFEWDCWDSMVFIFSIKKVHQNPFHKRIYQNP
jgi:hypothetical protein